MTPPIGFSLDHDGNDVILTFKCRDNYHAIELLETMANSIEGGTLDLAFFQSEEPQ